MTSQNTHASAVKALQKELTDLNSSPIEGVKVDINSVQNMFTWDVAIFGPPMTLYEGGYFKARLEFPHDYPYNPPSVHFTSEMFHPNIYETGEVCISILHPPVDDPLDDEPISMRWNPTQTVRTVLLSIISLLNEPNINSPAHLEASIHYQRWLDSNGEDNSYEKAVRSLVERTYVDAKKDGVVVPKTLAEYCISRRPSNRDSIACYGTLDNTEYEPDDGEDVFDAFDVDEEDEESDCADANEQRKDSDDQVSHGADAVAVNTRGFGDANGANSAVDDDRKGPTILPI